MLPTRAAPGDEVVISGPTFRGEDVGEDVAHTFSLRSLLRRAAGRPLGRSEGLT